jgi:2-hydroxychromene-2-carboxylate isomerase
VVGADYYLSAFAPDLLVTLIQNQSFAHLPSRLRSPNDTMARPKINLYFDPVSPFSYMGMWALEVESTNPNGRKRRHLADRKQNLPSFRGCERTYTPIFLGGLMAATENTPPIQIINKGKWVNADRLRWARLFGIPMQENTPADFPPRTLTVRRAMPTPRETKNLTPGEPKRRSAP